ncbi:DUF302 domain-containing protein [Streptosporangium lutulentum]
MRPTKVVIFGSPAAGTPLMIAVPLLALDLPLKILIWQDASGRTRVSHDDVDALQKRHGLTDEQAAPLRGSGFSPPRPPAPDPRRCARSRRGADPRRRWPVPRENQRIGPTTWAPLRDPVDRLRRSAALRGKLPSRRWA